jgi:TonB family protein
LNPPDKKTNAVEMAKPAPETPVKSSKKIQIAEVAESTNENSNQPEKQEPAPLLIPPDKITSALEMPKPAPETPVKSSTEEHNQPVNILPPEPVNNVLKDQMMKALDGIDNMPITPNLGPVEKNKPASKIDPLQDFVEADLINPKFLENPNTLTIPTEKPPVMEDLFNEFDELVMEDIAKPTISKENAAVIPKENESNVELALVTPMNINKKLDNKSAANMLTEIQNAENLLTEIQNLSKQYASESSPPVRNSEPFIQDSKQVKPLDLLIKKLKTERAPAKEVEIDVMTSLREPVKYKSGLRDIPTPVLEKLPKKFDSESTNQTSNPSDSANQTDNEIVSLYISRIQKKIANNWKNPLGSFQNDVIVTFDIFSQGNIGEWSLEKSSGDTNLDNLAVKAILKSEPFPIFPKDMKEFRLNISINFKYLLENKQAKN